MNSVVIRGVLIVGLALGLGAIGCGDDDDADGDCEAPAGTYSVEVVDAGGDCDQEIVDQITGTQDVEVEEGVECGNYTDTVSYTENYQGGSCTENWMVQGNISSTGFEDMSVALEVECDGEVICEHNLNEYYELR